MRLFSNIFKSKTKKVVETRQGPFTLIYCRKGKNIWSNSTSEISISVRGSENEPDNGQLNFFENITAEIQKLDETITKRFIKEFKEADIETNFVNWKERFKIVAADVMLIFQKETYWNITFEDLNTPYTHFTLYVEGQKTTDFAIDT